ncbi:MAG: PD-(D/E)XK motif protein [Ignavibacteriae bacterium]|nr:PD-(D/E)XK motif protein [Ignavibacteriota bacterium]
MITIEKLREYFRNRLQNRTIPLENHDHSFVYCTDDKFGILIPYNQNEPIKLRFSASGLEDVTIDGDNKGRYLYFYCINENLINQFSMTCIDFISKDNREIIQSSPQNWWDNWKKLMGNAIRDESVYSTIGELIVFIWEIKNNHNETVWSGPKSGSHDIETSICSFEVKSTIKHYERIVTISGEFQLNNNNNKPLQLVFLRFEPCLNGGFSIEKCVQKITEPGIKNEVYEILKDKKYEPGTPQYKDEYTLKEACIYIVDDNFPKITMEMLNILNLNKHIRKFSYDIDLSGLTSKNILSELIKI